LLSICIFERLNTVTWVVDILNIMLWIAFDLYLWKIEHSFSLQLTLISPVVNCFRFVSLKDWTQWRFRFNQETTCCELLSICIFERLNTVFNKLWMYLPMLWIAFDLYLWKIEHSLHRRRSYWYLVVNCFRFVSLKDWTQSGITINPSSHSCELLSICIFERLNTVEIDKRSEKDPLWIAFDLYLWKIEHSTNGKELLLGCVVNCFRFVSLKDWTQSVYENRTWNTCCELLSICIFERLNTVMNCWMKL